MNTIGYGKDMVKENTQTDKKPETNQRLEHLFIPDLCNMRMVFVVVMVAELFAIVLALATVSLTVQGYLLKLALISLFVQWAALGSSGVLCIVRPYLVGMSNRHISIASFSLILLVVALISEMAYWALYYPDSYANEHWHFLFRNLVITVIVSGLVLRYFYMQHQWRQRIKTESQARLQALQSRIRPHFLFNSMNTIASLTRTNPGKAEQAVEDLAELFRISLGDARSRYAMADELLLCKRYLGIEGLRLDDRLKVEWDTDALPEDARVPPLLLQPLLENAIYHGIETLPGGGTIKILGQRNGRKLNIKISNPFPGNEPQQHQKGNKIAMNNIRERLQAVYDQHGKLETELVGNEYQVTVYIPYWRKEDEDTDRG
ncbi:MAG: histidine kinase [Gammaproteobacteria bacterium]|nr:histidine kinase [Gammaproteobacteria bacterium]